MTDMTRRGILAGSAAAAALLLGGEGAMAQSRRILVLTSNQDIPNFDPHLRAIVMCTIVILQLVSPFIVYRCLSAVGERSDGN